LNRNGAAACAIISITTSIDIAVMVDANGCEGAREMTKPPRRTSLRSMSIQ